MRLDVGQAVYVPFGRRTLQGIVLELPEVPSYPETRDVLAPLTEGPILSPAQVALGRWISEEYLAPLFLSLALMLPPGFEQKPLTYVVSLVGDEEVAALDLSLRQREVLAVLLADGRQEVEELRKRARVPALAAILGQLEKRGLVERSYGLARSAYAAQGAWSTTACWSRQKRPSPAPRRSPAAGLRAAPNSWSAWLKSAHCRWTSPGDWPAASRACAPWSAPACCPRMRRRAS